MTLECAGLMLPMTALAMVLVSDPFAEKEIRSRAEFHDMRVTKDGDTVTVEVTIDGEVYEASANRGARIRNE